MFNRIMSALLSLSLCMNTVFAQEIKTDDAWDLTDTPMVWSPAKKKLKFGELEVEVWVLPQARMTAPDAGYLLYRSDVSQLLERMNNIQVRINEVIGEERYACDIQLKEKDESCIRQQEALQIKFDEQVKTIKRLNGDVDDRDNTIFYWQLGTGGAAILALSFGLFAISK